MEETNQKTGNSIGDVFSKLGSIGEHFAQNLKSATTHAIGELKEVDFKKFVNDVTTEIKNRSKDTLEDLQRTLNEVFKNPDVSEALRNKVRTVKNFPKQGVDFLDISPLILSPDAFTMACLAMIRGVNMSNVDYIVGIESRGFLFATKIAEMFDKGLILVRKRGKLPPPVMSQNYTTEYSTDVIEIHPGIGNVLIVDDILATGGTLKSTVSLCKSAGYQVEAASVFMDTIHLHPENLIDVPLVSGLQMSGQS